MAKIEFEGLDRYRKLFADYTAGQIEADAKAAVYMGAKVVLDEARNLIQTHPTHNNPVDGMTKTEQKALLDGLGAAPMRKTSGGDIDTKMGFDGYDTSRKTKTWPKGVPISVTARSLEKGTNWRKKDPFLTKLASRTKDSAVQAMEAELDRRAQGRFGKE